MCVTWLIRMCCMWLIRTCDVTRLNVVIILYVIATLSYDWRVVSWSHMGWLRRVDSFKLYVSFAKEPYKRDHILQKRPVILRSLLIVATTYVFVTLRRVMAKESCDSFACVTWIFICVTWLIRMCDMTHLCMWYDSFANVTWLIHVCDMTDLYLWHDSFMCVTWLLRVCDVCHMTPSRVWHDSFTCVT